jgi:cyclopropane-fatty-acyl-phospholipid synthase
MIADSSFSATTLPAARAPGAARFVLRLLERLRFGSLAVHTPDGAVLHFGGGAPSVQLRVNDWEVFAAALRAGDIGFAECYLDGRWSTDDLAGLLELLARNREQVEQAVYGNWFGSLVYRIRHLLNRNSRSGSRRNIHAHYDIGNDFYRLWLDASMTYSSAWFAEPGMTLGQAQAAKYHRILDELQVAPGARVLEIGCGWGGFAELAVREGMVLKGVTLSTEQLEYARRRLWQAGLEADLALCDYRDIEGKFDAVASIEMFEAVGESYWDSYFACVARSLRSGGRACIQTITIDESLFERYRTGTDFIQQYIFPGGMLPSPTVFESHARAHGLRLVNTLRFGRDYADTLLAWRHAFHARLDEVKGQGFDERFIRTWEFYLCYCEAAFRSGNTDVIQFTLERT